MEDQIQKLLKQLVSINSIYPNENNLVLLLEKMFKSDYKITKQKVENKRSNLLVEKGRGKQTILLYSHLDTVDIIEGWKTDPLDLKVIEDRAYGLGSWDMKGGMSTNILSFFNSQPKNFKLKMVFCVDEENISKGGFKLMNSKFMKDVVCVISTEPSFFYGNNGVVIGRPGRTVYQMEITGRPNHYALYDHRIDINLFISEFIKNLRGLYKKNGNKKQFIFIRKINSKTIGMSTPHIINLELDSSIIPPKRSDQIKKEIENIAIKVNTKYSNYFKFKINYLKRETPFLESYEINKNNKYLKILSKSINKITKSKAIPYFRSSIADENIFGSFGKTVLSIGPTGGSAHAPNEWISLSSLEKLYNILNDFLIRVDKSYDLGR
ncbi:MAG: ArgE/DapE-related deacylase [Candidatus Roizmanbacteria bacterium GW2011_GWC2_37_13]|uniref:ArgE/DapE-related deacylase n=1 Tax=Candidatus Roizmanbacteria bacterium GW2011_GWC2_37_13 TaxID=1618486 RepID=A0A0G0JEH2_9BACT|nr:MAG: ArgE/DapE-related deacylase [Candidatus Roizmanbacteria bacterium GW2011_GWC1_37_12]KKQ26576.1 MAG: ArgE/DapE-related deacylase [Candidatus Roizmanbacteria bacterium GW2011_GWC2_37_13]